MIYDWTKLLNKTLEKVLPVTHVVREPGIPIEIGLSRRVWHADYTFTLNHSSYVVEAKLGKVDRLLDGTKVIAYQRLYNLHTRQNRQALIIARAKNINAADLLVCGILKVSVLTVDFKELGDNSIRFLGKLDGSVTYECIISPLTGLGG